MTQEGLKELLQQLAEERNLDLRGYKTSTLERRFRHRMFQLKIGNYADYAAYIRDKPAEVNDLLNTVLINVTQFFRDPQAWDILRKEILPDLTRSLARGDIFRAWSAGCASGEEAYSLAILVAEHFGDKLNDYDIKVYATDVDVDALNIARHGEYTSDKLRYVRPEWRRKYFTGNKVCHVHRDIRHMVIFGHGNLASHAPISHVHLLLCRNLLIYFDSQLQKHILNRLHYALEPGGVLMLGKSESQLGNNSQFQVLNSKWRIFQRIDSEAREHRRSVAPREESAVAKAREEPDLLSLYHKALLETLQPGVLVLDSRGVIISENEGVSRLWNLKEKIAGKAIQETAIPSRAPELLPRLEAIRATGGQATFQYAFEGDDNEQRQLAVTLKAIMSPGGGNVGTLIHVEDASPQQKLQHTIEELETTSEELQSTNEELETTNEELQSANEELETTNEELQSTNEELETTNEELQALNEELGTTNEELEVRTRELDEVNARYLQTLEKMPVALMLVAKDGEVQFWNASAQALFGLPSKSVTGLQLRQLPLPESLRNALARSHHEAVVRGKPRVVRNISLNLDRFRGSVDVRFTPLSAEVAAGGVLVMFEAPESGSASRKIPNKRAKFVRRAAAKEAAENPGHKRPGKGRKLSRKKRR